MKTIFANATVIADLEANSKRRALQAMAEAVAKNSELDVQVVMDNLLAREQLGATGVGGGVAMPHGRIAGLESVVVGFARLAKPIEYESPDGAPVDLVMLLLAPEEAGAACLKALSKASRVLRNPEVCRRVRAAADAEEMVAILTEAPQAKAA